MEITIEDEKSVNGSVVNRGTISMYKKVRSSKKICFTPTQSSETSEHYYVLDEKAIPSFDTVLHKTEPIKIMTKIAMPVGIYLCRLLRNC